jgi:N utilization substance protein B
MFFSGSPIIGGKGALSAGTITDMAPDGSNTHHYSPARGVSTRREARELALRMLFQLDVGKQPLEEVVEAALEQSRLEGRNRAFAEEVTRGTWAHRSTLDAKLATLTTDWAPDRQAAVDRNILRLGAYELMYVPESPVAAVVNEAVELAKKYSTEESGRFVNGVLGALARQPRGAEPLEERSE